MAPKVFVSYAHDSAEHKDEVREFATFLRGQGIEAVLDVWCAESRRDWYSWMVRQLTGADHVIVVASAKLRRAADGLGEPDEHQGVQSEAALLRELLCEDRATWVRKILPVVLPGHGIDEIPLFLQPHTASRYVVTELTAAGADDLLRVINQHPVHVAPPVSAPPARRSSLVGRDDELARFTGLVNEAVAGRGRAVLVDGEPGIGKSALVAAVCADSIGRCRVLWGAGDELGQALPLLPLLDALRAVRDEPRVGTIGRLLRGEVPPGGADPVAAASEQILALAGELCASGPVILVVDDLQWADRATLAVWARLARRAVDLPLLLVGVTRPVPRTVELQALRRSAAVHLGLGPLPSAAVLDFLSSTVGGRPGDDLVLLAQGAAGNPLYLGELVDALRREGALRVAGSGVTEPVADRVPGSLVAAIESRLELAVGPVGDLLRAAALLGVEFSATELAIVLESRMPALGKVLDEAVAAGVLRDGADQLAFRHPLIHQVLYESMPASVRTAWHLDAARALAAAGAPVHRVARQLLNAIRDSRVDAIDDWLRHWLVLAAPSLVAQSPALAVELLRAAVSDPATGGHGTHMLACRLADALFRTGDAVEAERIAASTAAVVTDPDLVVDLQWTLTQCRALTGRSAESLVALERSLAAPDIDPGHHARLLVLTARTQRNLGRVGESVASAGEALVEAEAVGDRWAIGWALHVLIIGAIMRGEVAAALPLFERALAVTGDDATLADLRMLVQINYAVALGDLDEYDRAIAAAQEVRHLAEGMGNLIRLAQAHSALSELYFDTGRWDDALREVDSIVDGTEDPGVTCCAHGVAALIWLHRGGSERARHHLELSEPLARRIGKRVVSSFTLATSFERESGGPSAEALSALTSRVTAQAEELDEVEDLLQDAVRLAVALGEQDTAAELTERAERLEERSRVPHRSAVAMYCRALLDGNARGLVRAAECFRRAGRPLPRAKALEAAAAAFAAAGDLTAAQANFMAAYAGYAELGAERDTARLAALRGRYRVRRSLTERHQKASLAPEVAPDQTPYEFLRRKIQEPMP